MILTINKFKSITAMIVLSAISINLYADVNMNDSADNLEGANVTTLINFNNPKIRPAYGYAQLGTTGVPYVYIPDDGGVKKGEIIDDFLENKAEEGDILYLAEVDMRDKNLRRYPSDIFLPLNNTYKTKSSISSYHPQVGSYYELATQKIFEWKNKYGEENFILLYISIQRFKVVKHRCTSKDSEEIIKRCKGKKTTLLLVTFLDDFSIGEVTSVLKPIVSIDLNTIPRVVIPGNNK